MINPLKRIKNQEGWTIMEMASVCDLSASTIYKNITGSNKNITNKILMTLDEMNYKIIEIEKEYQEFRKAKKEELMYK